MEIRVAQTVVKILIALLVLYVLAALLLPSRGSGERARRTQCLSDLRQLGLCMAVYAEKFDGRLPMDGNPPTLVGSMRLLSNVVSDARMLYCPSDERRGAVPCSDFRKLTIKNISYSYVPNLIWRATNTETILMLDRIYTTEQGDRWPADKGNHGDVGGNVLLLGAETNTATAIRNRAFFAASLPFALRDKDGRAVVLSP